MIAKILLFLLGCLVVLGMVGLVTLLPAFIAWLLYVYAVAPVFHWPVLGFWKCFLILWFFSLVINFFRKS